ncbi:MAG TPA: aspartate--ammonia ligase [Sedimentisphaerales bacterium]|jgi:aspartate--ammonia ligase|nr:aspartate--ammonia ligase [Sedimentisphaerales bacterium]HNU29574.1 aspartate--ammonia ligase [Sedimentisphaerales bacterium]
MPDLILAEGYRPILGLRETERAIKFIKDCFQDRLATALNLQRVSAPLFLRKGSGINDDLNGIEAKAAFRIKDDDYAEAECLFSLAKWKRMVLADYGFAPGEGLYTDMNAIRPDEECLDNLHSVYVDQWDWERILCEQERNLDFLRKIVRTIYSVLRETEKVVTGRYPQITPILPEEISFVHAEELLARWPEVGPRERENRIAQECGAVFVIGIGGPLADGTIHDGRAPDYDDWITPTVNGCKGLNGDILLWYPLLNRAFEISSMGIRVNADSLRKQLEIRGAEDRLRFDWHRRLLAGELPLTLGGGIGQSRLCMFFLRKLHVGEVHASVWPRAMVERCKAAGVTLL